MYKIIKNVYKIRFGRDHFEPFNIWAKRKGLSVVIKILSPICCLPLPWAIYMWKNMKKPVDIVLKLATNGQSDKGFPVADLEGVWGAQLNPPWSPNYFIFMNCVKRGQNGQIKPPLQIEPLSKNSWFRPCFLLTSTFVPKGLSAYALGLYTSCIKALKYIPGPGVRWAFTGPLVLWLYLSDWPEPEMCCGGPPAVWL